MKKILENIKKIRVQKKLTQFHIASELGIATSNYSRIETGKQEVTLSNFMRIAEILGVSPETLFADNAKEDVGNSNIKATLMIELKRDKKEQILKLVFGDNNLEILNK